VLILFLNHKGIIAGKLHTENTFNRNGDYITNRKAIQAKCREEVYNLVLLTTSDIEERLIGNQKDLLVSNYPKSLDDYYFKVGNTKLFPIEALVIPIYGKWHYMDRFEPPTEPMTPEDYARCKLELET
jgi:hypothetical protein